MLKVGLTGGIGSGKSTISSLIKEKGIKVIDADIIAREVLTIYPEICVLIKKEFGEQFFDEQDNLKRKEFGNFIFKNKEYREKLDLIMIPFIKNEILKRLEEYSNEKIPMCIVDAPTLIEHNIHKDMDVTILVWVDQKIQIQRVKDRDFITEEQVVNRINSQMSLSEKKKHANFIIDNSNSKENTIIQLELILEELNSFFS